MTQKRVYSPGAIVTVRGGIQVLTYAFCQIGQLNKCFGVLWRWTEDFRREPDKRGWQIRLVASGIVSNILTVFAELIFEYIKGRGITAALFAAVRRSIKVNASSVP